MVAKDMEQDGLEAPFASTYTPTPMRSRKRNIKRVVIVLLIFLLVGAIGIGATKFMPAEKEKTSEMQPTPTLADVFPSDTPTPELSPTPAPTKKAEVNPVDKATGLDRSALSIAIQNGNGTVGVASKASDVLTGFGYHVTSLGNAPHFNYEKTEIQVKSSKAQYLPLLKKDLSGIYAIGSTSATLSASSSEDAVVIIGKE